MHDDTWAYMCKFQMLAISSIRLKISEIEFLGLNVEYNLIRETCSISGGGRRSSPSSFSFLLIFFLKAQCELFLFCLFFGLHGSHLKTIGVWSFHQTALLYLKKESENAKWVVHKTWAGLFDSFVPGPSVTLLPPSLPQLPFRSWIGAYLFSSTWEDGR